MGKQKFQLNQYVRIKTGNSKGKTGRIIYTAFLGVPEEPETGRKQLLYYVNGKYYSSGELELLENQPTIVDIPLKEPFVFIDKDHLKIAINKPSEFDKLISILKDEKEKLIRSRQKAFDEKHQLSLF